MSKKKISLINSIDDCKSALQKASVLHAIIEKARADYNAKEQERRRQFDESVAEQSAQLKMWEKEIESYCKDNKNLFDDTRTMHLVHGSVGFRIGNPAVKNIKGVDDEGALNLLNLHAATEYIRVSHEINRDAIKNAYTTGVVTDEQLALYGLRIEQAERFRIEYHYALDTAKGGSNV